MRDSTHLSASSGRRKAANQSRSADRSGRNGGSPEETKPKTVNNRRAQVPGHLTKPIALGLTGILLRKRKLVIDRGFVGKDSYLSRNRWNIDKSITSARRLPATGLGDDVLSRLLD